MLSRECKLAQGSNIQTFTCKAEEIEITLNIEKIGVITKIKKYWYISDTNLITHYKYYIMINKQKITFSSEENRDMVYYQIIKAIKKYNSSNF